ncbi:MAG: hypothetical protein QCH99_08340 [Candidatus Bathyarchaeota archaeon]|nr:hypothetical protein [Candidatus Bathyarchaeum tardum]
MTKLGQIQKPKVSDFEKSRKLYCLPMIPNFNQDNLSEELKQNIQQFWTQATSKIEELEKLGKITNIYVETITQTQIPALDLIKKLSTQLHQIIIEKLDKGANLVPVEDQQILDELIDWSVCLSVIRKSQKVFNKIYHSLQETKNQRNQQIAKKIDQTLKNNECGMMVMTDENRLEIQPNLPSDIQVFLVHPPAFNDVIQGFKQLLEKQNHNCSQNH